jgi:hypothetical protein
VCEAAAVDAATGFDADFPPVTDRVSVAAS